MRKTTGSANALPPPRSDLIEAFSKPHHGKLSVGARALSKHYHRSQNLYWGELKGGDEKKSEQASQMLRKLIDDCVWINSHMLPV